MFASSFVILCVILFVLFNMIAIFFLKESYGIKSFSIPNSTIAWGILKNHTKYSLWWNHFANSSEDDLLDDIEIKDKIDNSLLKFKYDIDGASYEIWTFFLVAQDDDYMLHVKKEFHSDSLMARFYHKFIANDRSIKQFFVNFKKAYKSIDETSFA